MQAHTTSINSLLSPNTMIYKATTKFKIIHAFKTAHKFNNKIKHQGMVDLHQKPLHQRCDLKSYCVRSVGIFEFKVKHRGRFQFEYPSLIFKLNFTRSHQNVFLFQIACNNKLPEIRFTFW